MGKEKIFLGFDFGIRHIGVATGQTLTKTATPLTVIKVPARKIPWNEIDTLVNEWQPDGFVVGMPLNMDGTEQPFTKDTKAFAKELQDRYKIPVYEMDERLTTREAREQIFEQGGYKALQQGPVDSIAAKIILESWFQNK